MRASRQAARHGQDESQQDKEVVEATENRKDESKECTELMAANAVAKEFIEFAKNRFNELCNPKLHKPAGLAQVHSHRDAPLPPPESFDTYSQQSEESNGIIAMTDTFIQDLDKEMTEAEVEEKDAQVDCEQVMKDSADNLDMRFFSKTH